MPSLTRQNACRQKASALIFKRIPYQVHLFSQNGGDIKTAGHILTVPVGIKIIGRYPANHPLLCRCHRLQRISAALYADIQDKQPDLVLDLHEALVHTDDQDNLGNSIICQDMQPIADLVLNLLADSDNGVLPLTEPLDLFGSPPEGSLNRTVTLELGIPVITVETSRQEELGVRVSNQLHVVEYILIWYNML